MSKKKKIIFICKAVTLAHMARSRLLADHINHDKYEVIFYRDPHYDHLFKPPVYTVKPLGGITPAEFIKINLESRPVWSRELIDRYLKKDFEIFEEEKPDIVVGDLRHSLQISARKYKIPYVNIMNAHWNPVFFDILPVPDVAARRILGTFIAQKIVNLFYPLFMQPHIKHFKKARKDHGLPALKGKTLHPYFSESDYLIHPDLEELYEPGRIDSQTHFIGPVNWAPHIELPTWWDAVPQDKPIIYINLGSSGDPRFLRGLVERLARHDVTLLVATVDKDIVLPRADNIFSSVYLPGDQACKKADIFICNGGTPSMMQGLAGEAYSIGVCFNIDQLVNMHFLSKAGLGKSFYAAANEIPAIEKLCLSVLDNKPDFSQIAARINNNNPFEKFNKLIDSI